MSTEKNIKEKAKIADDKNGVKVCFAMTVLDSKTMMRSICEAPGRNLRSFFYVLLDNTSTSVYIEYIQ